MKRSFFGKACFTLLFYCMQVGGIYANNGGTQPAAPAPKPAKFRVSIASLEKLDRILTSVEKQKNTKKSAVAGNSTITNLRMGGEDMYMTSFYVYLSSGSNQVVPLYEPGNLSLPNGATASFTMPQLPLYYNIKLGHISSFTCYDYAILTTADGWSYWGQSDCMSLIEWYDAPFGNSDLSKGVTLTIY